VARAILEDQRGLLVRALTSMAAFLASMSAAGYPQVEI
jgi:hypothetical protein